jgi:hypothetical protein
MLRLRLDAPVAKFAVLKVYFHIRLICQGSCAHRFGRMGTLVYKLNTPFKQLNYDGL